jgi:hypothetical protein
MGSAVTKLTESMDNSFMEEAFYKWWEDVMGLFSAERRNEFETSLSIQEQINLEELAKSAFMAGVKSERKRIHKKCFGDKFWLTLR